jgi:hypothetical protein
VNFEPHGGWQKEGFGGLNQEAKVYMNASSEFQYELFYSECLN